MYVRISSCQASIAHPSRHAWCLESYVWYLNIWNHLVGSELFAKRIYVDSAHIAQRHYLSQIRSTLRGGVYIYSAHAARRREATPEAL